jgi:hypothetical protein
MTDDQKNNIVGALVVVGGALLITKSVKTIIRRKQEEKAHAERMKKIDRLNESMAALYNELELKIKNIKSPLIGETDM